MKRSVKQKWIDALRSGDYPQGKSYLLNEEGLYCCLGVLGDIYGTWIGGMEEEEVYDGDTDSFEVVQQFEAMDLLTVGTWQNLNVTIDDGRPIDQEKFAEMNDGGYWTPYPNGLSFNEIADWIDEHVDAEDD